MRVLVAVDFGMFGRSQIAFLEALQPPPGSSIKVLHVIEPVLAWSADHPSLSMVPMSAETIRQQRQASSDLVHEVADSLKSICPLWVVDSELRLGAVADEILNAAEEWRAELIVVGSHGRKGIQRFLLGSVSAAVSQHAGASVAITRLPAAGEG